MYRIWEVYTVSVVMSTRVWYRHAMSGKLVLSWEERVIVATVAVAAYVRMLADVQRISLTELAEFADVQLKYLRRMETGEIKQPSGLVLRKFTELVRGNWEQIGQLLTDQHASAEDGRALALSWAVDSGLLTNGERRILAGASREELQQAADRLRRFAEGFQ